MRDLLNDGNGGTHVNSYYAASANPPTPYPRLSGDCQYDVCIVGAGYTGLSAALFLAQKGFRVAVLEANRVGWGASGRNGGQLGTGQRLDQITLETKLGIDKARALWDLAEDGKALVKQLIGTHAIACDLKPGVLSVDHKKHFSAGTAAYVETLNQRYGYADIDFLNVGSLRQEIGSDVYFSGSLDRGAAHLHPLNFAMGLAAAAKSAGAEIFEGTRVEKIVPGATVKLHTRDAVISAAHVIVAGNGYMGQIEPQAAAHIMPINSYIIATAPLDADLARDIIRHDVAVVDSKFVVNYFRLTADQRLLFGGVESYGYGEPKHFARKVQKRMLGIYPQLRDISIDYGWGGTLGITMNRLPYLARPSANIIVAGGYSGHGLGLATLCGQLIGQAIAGQAEKYDIMASLPIPQFPGGTLLRHPLLLLAMVYYAARDRL